MSQKTIGSSNLEFILGLFLREWSTFHKPTFNPSMKNGFLPGDRKWVTVVAATHDTPYQNDAGGIKASSRWLSEATPSGHEMGVKAAGTPAVVQDLMPRCRPVVSSITLLNHRLLAPDASGIVSIKKCHSWPRRV